MCLLYAPFFNLFIFIYLFIYGFFAFSSLLGEVDVATLALGSEPRPRGYKVLEQEEARDVATLALARDQGKGVARLRAYK
jgi:hypothetical protein